VVERRQDSCGERGRAPAIDELEHGVQVDAAVSRQPGGEIGGEPRGYESSATPSDDRADLGARIE